MKHKSLRVAFWAALFLPVALVVGSLLVGGEPTGSLSATDGIRVGQRFTVPILVGTKQVNGRAVVTADRLLVILCPSADGLSVEELAYTLTRQDVTPDPQPGPKPKPDPQPTPVPVPTPGKLYVLIYYDSDALDNGAGPQAGILTAKEVRDYLDGHCERIGVKLPNGKQVDQPAYRFLSKSAEADKLPEKLRGWLADAKARKIPNITIHNGRDTYRGDLPADAGATLKLLKQFGGL